MTNRVISPPKGSQVIDGNDILVPVWLNWFNNVYRYLNFAPITTNGILPPAVIPQKVGDMYIDTVAKKVYAAVGTTSIGDWEVLN